MMRVCRIAGAALLLAMPAVARAQDDKAADRPLATREELQSAMDRARARSRPRGSGHGWPKATSAVAIGSR